MARISEPNAAIGTVVAISISERKGIPKSNVPAATLVADWGIEGDAHAGAWHRQVSLLAIESIEKMRAKGLDVGPGAFAENITTEFIDIPHLHVGDRVRIAEAELEITQIGKECHSRCAIFQAAGDCVMPREGIFGRVIVGGPIRVGDSVSVLHAPDNVAAEGGRP
jgi:MOSC domain-containing protein YiiM